MMPGRRTVPSYRLHKPTGQAVVRIDGRDHYLGKHGTDRSREEYVRVLAQWRLGGPTRSADDAPSTITGLSVNALILAYRRFAERNYVHSDGRPSGKLGNTRDAVRSLRRLYGLARASSFGPMALETVRQSMIDGGLCGRTINNRVARIKRMFKWGVENELVPATIYHGIQAVAGIRIGREGVREADPVKPVPNTSVEAIYPNVNVHVAAMIRLQLFTGMRPGEVVTMRGCDLETNGITWLYRPESHKTAHHGHPRIIAIGPRAQSSAFYRKRRVRPRHFTLPSVGSSTSCGIGALSSKQLALNHLQWLSTNWTLSVSWSS